LRFLISVRGDPSEAMSKSKKKKGIKGEEEEMSELEIIRQKCEVQKKQSGYEKRIRKQVKEKLGKIKNQYRGELN
jgi:hypothetical protein